MLTSYCAPNVVSVPVPPESMPRYSRIKPGAAERVEHAHDARNAARAVGNRVTEAEEEASERRELELAVDAEHGDARRPAAWARRDRRASRR